MIQGKNRLLSLASCEEKAMNDQQQPTLQGYFRVFLGEYVADSTWLTEIERLAL